MKFKKLEVAGFKSFADKLEVKFGAGITAIVGPNGCGKSNVADSIRWVLGEQSAKLLRGSSMQDVIFNGTEKRKSLSFCEVSLVFDNSEKLFPTLDYNEVVISRKLYRSGESEYLVNKTVCRLKDIVDLLRDAGMGREGYSIIGQGRIDELLSSKPEDRREIFEEAAGISKFKARKKEAERKLARTSENLTRVNDILEEKAKQLEPLTRQSENARKWLDLRDKLKHYEINTYIYQYDTANEAKEVINNRLNGILEEMNLRQRESDDVAKSYNEAMVAVGSADKSIEELREELLTLTVGMEKQAGELKLLKERLGYLTSQSEKLREENAKLDADYALALEYIEQGSAALTEKREQLEEKRVQADKASDDYLNVIETLTVGEGEVEQRHKAIIEAMDKLADIKANMSRLLAERDALHISIDDLKNRIAFNKAKLKIDKQNESAVAAELAEMERRRDELIKERDGKFTLNNECLAIINDCAVKLDKLNATYYSLRTRHKMLKEMQQAYEGFAFSVKKLISVSKTDKDVARSMEGVVASLITVKSPFETAIEMALGNAVQNIVTKNEDDAKFLIAYLKEHNYGRVTFLPITSIKPRNIDKSFDALIRTDGCYGRASDLVSCDVKYRGIVEGLLGGTVIVDNMDTAIALAKKSGYGFKIVTLDGDIVNPHGSITGGSKKSELTNIFGYDKEIAALEKELSDVSAKIDELSKLRDEKSALMEKGKELTRGLRDEIHNLEVEHAGKAETHNKLKDIVEELEKSSEELENEIKNSAERIDVIDNNLNSVSELENLITSEKEDAAAGGEERQQQFEALRAERDRLHELMTNAKVDVSTLENVIANTETEIARLQDNVRSYITKIEYNNAQLSENESLISKIDSEMNRLTIDEGAGDTERVKEIRKTLANLDEFKQRNQEKVTALDAEKTALVSKIQELLEKKNKEEMLLLKVDTDIEQMQQRVMEEYSLEYKDCLPFKEENYNINEGVTAAARLKRQMHNLGNINLDAIEQCKLMYESYNELNVQKEDLDKAKYELEKIIAELSAEMLSRFSEQFEQIRTNFRKIFKELFDGGNADLILLENENPLEAGIEIVAQPPEKKLQSISLLSGGERALTAIAILFAILRLKPMPFCVLDEIEAALDDANAGRFAKYLRRFSEDTQFIVITHRKPTMELADNLYGVTMEEKGVSKIVSVKLSEAVAAAEQQNAG